MEFARRPDLASAVRRVSSAALVTQEAAVPATTLAATTPATAATAASPDAAELAPTTGPRRARGFQRRRDERGEQLARFGQLSGVRELRAAAAKTRT